MKDTEIKRKKEKRSHDYKMRKFFQLSQPG